MKRNDQAHDAAWDAFCNAAGENSQGVEAAVEAAAPHIERAFVDKILTDDNLLKAMGIAVFSDRDFVEMRRQLKDLIDER